MTNNRQERIKASFKAFNDECLLDFKYLGANTYITQFYGHAFIWPLFCFIRPLSLMFSSLLPVRIPSRLYNEARATVAQANNGLIVPGCYQFDPGVGEVRFVTTIEVADNALTVCQLFALYDAHHNAEVWIPKFVNLVSGCSNSEICWVLDQHSGQVLQQGLLDESLIPLT